MADKICFAAVILISYLLGSINASIVISNLKGTDIRKYGSGNAGATNMLRTYGKTMAVLALVFDALKGILAVGAAAAFQKALAQNGIESSLTDGLRYMGALFVVIGHNYPVFFGFKGGKGIATSGAVMFMLDWRAGLVVLTGAIAVMVITRYVSLGSMVGAVLYVAAPLFFNIAVDKKLNYWFIIVSVILAAMAVYRHKKNIVRLIHGTESKVGKSKKPEKTEKA